MPEWNVYAALLYISIIIYVMLRNSTRANEQLNVKLYIAKATSFALSTHVYLSALYSIKKLSEVNGPWEFYGLIQNSK